MAASGLGDGLVAPAQVVAVPVVSHLDDQNAAHAYAGGGDLQQQAPAQMNCFECCHRRVRLGPTGALFGLPEHPGLTVLGWLTLVGLALATLYFLISKHANPLSMLAAWGGEL
eukprot:SAG22_NODE_1455_length_4387_cov_108.989972_4_plen_113_part_00